MSKKKSIFSALLTTGDIEILIDKNFIQSPERESPFSEIYQSFFLCVPNLTSYEISAINLSNYNARDRVTK